MEGVPSPVSITAKNSKLYLGEKERRKGMIVTKKGALTKSRKWKSEGEKQRITMYLPEQAREKNEGKKMWVCYIKLGSDTGQHIRPTQWMGSEQFRSKD